MNEAEIKEAKRGSLTFKLKRTHTEINLIAKPKRGGNPARENMLPTKTEGKPEALLGSWSEIAKGPERRKKGEITARLIREYNPR